jgi:hypothetical protein
MLFEGLFKVLALRMEQPSLVDSRPAAPGVVMLTVDFPSGERYKHGWRDLRRRETVFWLTAVSFVPGVLLIMLVISNFQDDVPQHFGTWVGGSWLSTIFATGLYRRLFRCPRCRKFFFRWGFDQNPFACASCKLPREPLSDPFGGSLTRDQHWRW